MKPMLHPLILACAVLSWLVGCGPGVGGTGTGDTPVPLSSFGATAAPLCAAPFASSLQCTAGTGASPNPAIGGTAHVVFVDVATGGQTTAAFEASSVELDARCQRLRFVGEWGVGTAGEARFYGGYATDASATLRPAQLDVSAAVPNGLLVSLQLEDGSVALGPLLLRPESTPPEPPMSCP
jgi:hypothetical protein